MRERMSVEGVVRAILGLHPDAHVTPHGLRPGALIDAAKIYDNVSNAAEGAGSCA
jgi:hypothetical protein